jgi:protoporphyrin/coproporphyrin ferrochelatase
MPANRFTSSHSYTHAQPERTAVLLLQLGTPDAPRAKEVKVYLRQFLSDPRVVEIPKLVWAIILNGIILNIRPKKSAAKYATVWTDEGSPLAAHTIKQTKLLQGLMGERGHSVDVVYAMRYGNPSVQSVLSALREKNVTKLLCLPLYPQYAGATSATAMDAVFAELSTWRNQPELRTVRAFAKDDGYISAVAKNIQKAWAWGGKPEKLVMTFHGVPKRTLMLGDPYHCECLVSARLLAEKLQLRKEDYVVTFQSRFGKAEWLQPYTEPTLQALAQSGVKKIDIVCPGFVADCLETLEEIAMEGKEVFLEAGGTDYRYIPCLNESDDWIAALAKLTETHLQGWVTQRLDATTSKVVGQILSERQSAAKALGAKV